MIESRVIDTFVLNDQEILLRHLHKETAAWIEDYRRTTAVGV
jgi:glycine betaine catabolism A